MSRCCEEKRKTKTKTLEGCANRNCFLYRYSNGNKRQGAACTHEKKKRKRRNSTQITLLAVVKKKIKIENNTII